MMAERLAQMRAEYDSIEGKPSHTVGHIRELLDHIAQLEAQRGANVLATCANCAQRGHCVHAKLGEACEDHIVQRGGAVVVPEITVKQWIKEVLDAAYNDPEPHATMRAAAKWFRENAKAIPADRVLGEGMVGVDRETITRLSTAIDDVVITSAHHAIGSIEDKAVSVLCMAFSPIAKALRAQQAKGE